MSLTNHYLTQYFSYEHLPNQLQEVSRPFAELAFTMCATLPENPESVTMLRKLLEAKDCAVRAAIFKQPERAATHGTATAA